jgi:putative phosphoesterase
MKIGIISDTHKKTNRAFKAIDFLLENGVEFIIHAGDIVQTEILDYLEKKIRYIAVLGNNDYHLYSCGDKYQLVSEPYKFRLANKTFKLMHYPKHMFPLDTEIIIYGHTHVKDIAFNGKNLIINSGEVCARDTGVSNCMILEVKEDSYKITVFDRKIKTDKWEKIEREFNL